MELLVLGLFAGIGFASWALWYQARSDATAGARHKRLRAPVERTPMTIQVGDVVQHLGADYLVEGALTLSDEGRVARLYRLFDEGGERYLYAKQGSEEALLLAAVPHLALEGAPPESLTHAQQLFRQTARAQAKVARAGSIGDAKLAERAGVLEYTGPGPERLLLLEWNERVDAFSGERVPPSSLEILPAK
jgi:hypothetical protein